MYIFTILLGRKVERAIGLIRPEAAKGSRFPFSDPVMRGASIPGASRIAFMVKE